VISSGSCGGWVSVTAGRGEQQGVSLERGCAGPGEGSSEAGEGEVSAGGVVPHIVLGSTAGSETVGWEPIPLAMRSEHPRRRAISSSAEGQ
jgi:hypothetical protein